jgi:Mn-containing catalase
MRDLLRGKHGEAAALARYSHQSPAGSRISAQKISYFINKTEGRKGIALDDLDDLAAYFGKSIGELLGSPRAGELSAMEQRMIYSFRALDATRQDQMVSVVEMLSIASTLVLRNRKESVLKQLGGSVTKEVKEEPGAHLQPSTKAPAPTHADLERLRLLASDLAVQLAWFATGYPK